MATHPGATVEGTGERTLTAGENVISVTVTAEDETTQTYTVTVTVMMEGTQTLLEIYDTNTNGQIDRERDQRSHPSLHSGQILTRPR